MDIAIVVLVSLCVCSSGFIAVLRLKKRIALYGELSRLLMYMSEKIICLRMPLQQIFLSFDSDILDKCGFSEMLGKYGFSYASSRLDIESDIKNALSDLGNEIGLKNAGYASGRCSETAKLIGQRISRLKDEFPQRRKMYIGLSVAFGLMLFIVCI